MRPLGYRHQLSYHRKIVIGATYAQNYISIRLPVMELQQNELGLQLQYDQWTLCHGGWGTPEMYRTAYVIMMGADALTPNMRQSVINHNDDSTVIKNITGVHALYQTNNARESSEVCSPSTSLLLAGSSYHSDNALWNNPQRLLPASWTDICWTDIAMGAVVVSNRNVTQKIF